ncbi:MAG: hypothetical protein F6J97_21130, partial [Leptolyngbya sp. SIO4C1]|nr:hypothetical protein [Leptolyngbya sp. SIO4C1]
MLNPDFIAVIDHNQAALTNLQRALRLGAGQFSLILARVNYRRLRQLLLEQLAQTQPFQLVMLQPETVGLRDALKQSLPEAAAPQALMVTGLERVDALETMFRSANLGRDAFLKTFSCPVVLWVNDRVLQVLNTQAPDFKSFAAAPVRFDYPVGELISLLHRGADALFQHILDESEAQRFNTLALQLPRLGSELQTLIEHELPFALADLARQQAEIDADLQAGLQFLQGREAHRPESMMVARDYYEASLTHWLKDGSSAALDKQAVLLLHLGLWWRSYAVLQRSAYESACQQAKRYFEECLSIFQQQQRPDRTARFIHALAEVLQKLGEWEQLSAIAQTGLKLHRDDWVRLARDYGYLAEVALAQQDWPAARRYAEQALTQSQQAVQKAADSADAAVPPTAAALSLQYHQGWYHFLLGQAKLHQGQTNAALKALENARQQTAPRYDLSLYRQILSTLHRLYFERRDYLTAFHLKLEQRQVENRFGLRAFIGASQLQPYHQTPYLAGADRETLATEIRASGRQQDVDALVNRLVQPQHPLVVIHGQSGVGKSSILSAGLVPALRRVTPEGRVTIPVLVKGYHLWQAEILESLAASVEISREPPSKPAVSDGRGEGAIAVLRQRIRDRYEQIVLILDQFEEFFFERSRLEQRLAFYQFLRDCLNEPYIK